jgi:4-hydroxy-2-oxoheptanedioate aldolase
VHAPGGGAQAAGYAAQGATVVTAAVDASTLTDAVHRHLAVARELPPSGP